MNKPPDTEIDEPPGHHWKDAERVREFADRMERRAAERDPIFALLVRLIPFGREEALRVLDIGAGYGAEVEPVLKAFPNARADLLDVSEEMIRLGRERLHPYSDRYRYVLGDFADGMLPPEVGGPYHAVISSLAIHHLPVDGKRSLYRDIASRLVPGGVFLNLDIVAPADPALQAVYDRIENEDRATRGEPTASAQRLAHRHSELQPVIDHLTWLSGAGFAHVDVFWKRLGYALFGGIAPKATGQ